MSLSYYVPETANNSSEFLFLKAANNSSDLFIIIDFLFALFCHVVLELRFESIFCTWTLILRLDPIFRTWNRIVSLFLYFRFEFSVALF